MTTWEALRGVTLLCLALFIGAQALPGLRPYRRQIMMATLVLYFGALAVLVGWLLIK